MGSELSGRERAARAVYELRPFRTAMSTSPLDDGITQSRLFEFEGAPAYYIEDCYRIADAVLAAVDHKPKTPQVRVRWTYDLEACRPLIGQTEPDKWPMIPDQVAADPEAWIGRVFPIFEGEDRKYARLNPDQTLSKRTSAV